MKALRLNGSVNLCELVQCLLCVPYVQDGDAEGRMVFVCFCRSSCRTLAFAPKFPKRCPRGSPLWGRPTGWHPKSSLDCLMGRRWELYTEPTGYCKRSAVLLRMSILVCPGRYLVFGHHGDWDGGWGAPLLQRAPPAGHEEDTRQPAPPVKRVTQGTALKRVTPPKSN